MTELVFQTLLALFCIYLGSILIFALMGIGENKG